jgi:hypothetical protein
LPSSKKKAVIRIGAAATRENPAGGLVLRRGDDPGVGSGEDRPVGIAHAVAIRAPGAHDPEIGRESAVAAAAGTEPTLA